jgi:hypothetical protein
MRICGLDAVRLTDLGVELALRLRWVVEVAQVVVQVEDRPSQRTVIVRRG